MGLNMGWELGPVHPHTHLFVIMCLSLASRLVFLAWWSSLMHHLYAGIVFALVGSSTRRCTHPRVCLLFRCSLWCSHGNASAADESPARAWCESAILSDCFYRGGMPKSFPLHVVRYVCSLFLLFAQNLLHTVPFCCRPLANVLAY